MNGGAALPVSSAYVRQLEDAALALWAELPTPQVHLLERESPALVEFLGHLHHSIEHEQWMVRRNVWGQDNTESPCP